MKLAKTTTATFDDGTIIAMSPAVLMAVKFMIMPYGDRGPALLHAIKFVRMTYGISLQYAKDIVDELRNNPSMLD